MIRIEIILLMWLVPLSELYSQTPFEADDIVLSDQLDDEGAQYTDQKEYADALLQRPLNINTAGEGELAALYFLNDFQIRSIIDYRKQYGEFQSIYELQYVFGFDEALVKKLIPYIYLGDDVTIQSVSSIYRNSHELLIRYKSQTETPAGYLYAHDTTRNNYYTGSKFKKLLRYTFQPNQYVTIGLRGEKDAGEAFFKGSNKQGFDHYSGYLEIRDIGRFKQISIGDYAINLGQGLTFQTNQFFHSGHAASVVNRSIPLRTTTSADENRYLRGLAARYQWKNLEFVPFVSHKKVDANLIDTLDNDVYRFSSLQITGLHSTPAQIKDEKSLTETILGIRTSIDFEYVRLGLNAFHLKRNGQYQPVSGIPHYHLHPDFRAMSLDFKVTTGKTLWFGEISQSINDVSWMGGIHIFPSSTLYFTFLVRDYNEPEKHLYRNPFGMGSNIYFQRGAYCGVTIKPITEMVIRAYHDRYISHKPEYHLNQRQQKSYTFGEIDYTPNDRWSVKGRVKYREQYSTESSAENNVATSFKEKVTTGQLNFYYTLSSFRYQVQIARQQYNGIEKEQGHLISNHVVFQPNQWPVQFKTGQFMFRTDGYASRIYAYEPDVLYAFSIPSFYNKGLAYYLMMKFSVGYDLDLWFKYSRLLKPHEDQMGSGLNRINTNHRSYITAQLQLKF